MPVVLPDSPGSILAVSPPEYVTLRRGEPLSWTAWQEVLAL